MGASGSNESLRQTLTLLEVSPSTIGILIDDMGYGLNDLGDVFDDEIDTLEGSGGNVKHSDKTKIKKLIRYIRYVRMTNEIYDVEDREVFSSTFTREEIQGYLIGEARRISLSPGTPVPVGTPSTPGTTAIVTSTVQQEQNLVSVKMSDYPDFDGKMTSWFSFKQEFEGTADAAGMHDVLNI